MSDPVGRAKREWTVAISLLAADEPYGRNLEAEIRKHVRGEVFLYSSRQEEIARDGQLVELFSRVFDHEAKVAVVLYRKGWGETRYTALEQDALRARRLREGARGIVVVSLDGGFPSTWYPADHFRPGADEFTPAQIAALVAGRVQEQGGVIGPEPPVEKARRLATERQHQERLHQILQADGPNILEREVNALYEYISALADQISQDGQEEMSFDRRQRKCRVNYRWGSLACEWHRPVQNSLEGSELAFSIKDVSTHYSGRHQIIEPTLLLSGKLGITLPEENLWAWQFRSLSRKRAVTSVMVTSELGDWLIGELLDLTKGERPLKTPKRRIRRSGWLDDWRYR